MRTFTTLALAVSFSVPCAAQTKHVYPNQATSAEGSSSVDSHRGGAPWWSNPSQVAGEQYFRSQLISDLPGTISGNITSIAYRRDGSAVIGRTLENFFLEIEATMSTSPNTAASASTTFAANVGNDVTQVIARKNIAIGAKEFKGTFPEPLDYRFILDVPFPYSGASGSLCFDVKHYQNDMAHPLRPHRLHVALDSMTGSKKGPTLRNGGRCASENYWEPPIEFTAELFVDDSMPGTPRLRYYGHRQYGQHHSRGFFIGSLARVTPGAAIPGGCGALEMDPTVQFLLAISDSDGIYGRVRWPSTPNTWLFDLPYDPTWAGAQWYAQEVNLDVHTRIMSGTNWMLTQVPVYLPPGSSFGLRTVWAEGPGSHTAAQGTLGAMGVGPVVEYTTQ